MKKIIFIVILLCLYACNNNSKQTITEIEQEHGKFLNTEIQNIEKLTYNFDDNSFNRNKFQEIDFSYKHLRNILYGNYLDMPVFIIPIETPNEYFKDCGIIVLFDYSFSSCDEIKNKYNNIKNELTKKFGQPIFENIIDNNSIHMQEVLLDDSTVYYAYFRQDSIMDIILKIVPNQKSLATIQIEYYDLINIAEVEKNIIQKEVQSLNKSFLDYSQQKYFTRLKIGAYNNILQSYSLKVIPKTKIVEVQNNNISPKKHNSITILIIIFPLICTIFIIVLYNKNEKYKSIKSSFHALKDRYKNITEQFEKLKDEVNNLKKNPIQQKNITEVKNSNGIDPEMLAIGTELAVGYIERGVVKFSDFAKVMIKEVGEAIRPYLKGLYINIRSLLEEQGENVSDMDTDEEVSKFNVHNFDKEEKPTIFDKAIKEKSHQTSDTIRTTNNHKTKIYNPINYTRPIGDIYEEYVGHLLENDGYTVEYNGIEKRRKDEGIDIIAYKGTETFLIQCKCWKKNTIISSSFITKDNGKNSRLNCIARLYYQAKEYASSHNINSYTTILYYTCRVSENAKNEAQRYNIVLKRTLLPNWKDE